MDSDQVYDCAITGGGIAGLSLSIQLSRQGYRVAVFEKEKYPFHKVCGEYVSLESRPFLQSLGFSFEDPRFPLISRLFISGFHGNHLACPLPLGGFGISRYTLDHLLSRMAAEAGVRIFESCKINDISFEGDLFKLVSDTGEWYARTCAGAFGKRSNLDAKWKRDRYGTGNYIGIKYHVKGPFPEDTVSLHLFQNGYCGISPVENETHCLCYLTTAEQLSLQQNSIQLLEQHILCANPFIKKIFDSGQLIFDKPLVISGIHFSQKPPVENHILMIGDAAGMITPLCGNGMSMAMHASQIAAALMASYLGGAISRTELETQYFQSWNQAFQGRLSAGRLIQRLFNHSRLASASINLLRPFPGITRRIVKATHGKPF